MLERGETFLTNLEHQKEVCSPRIRKTRSKPEDFINIMFFFLRRFIMISPTLKKNLKVYRFIYDIRKKYGYQLFQFFSFHDDGMMMMHRWWSAASVIFFFIIMENAEKHELFSFFALRRFFFYLFLLHVTYLQSFFFFFLCIFFSFVDKVCAGTMFYILYLSRIWWFV